MNREHMTNNSRMEAATLSSNLTRRNSVRLRVARACDRCKKKKIRCTGTQPCEVCIKDHGNCLYTALYNRGRRRHIADRNRTTGRTGKALETVGRQQSVPELGAVELGDASTKTPPCRESPEPVTDVHGHYVGPASSLSFLARVRKRLNYGDHIFSTFTFGDTPLPSYEPISGVMISAEETFRLFNRFFDFTTPIDRLLHRPTIERWFVEFQETMGQMNSSDNAPARRAIIWMILAMAQEHIYQDSNVSTCDKSIRFFLAANAQLSKEEGTVSFASIQARLFQCFWLLSRSRVNHSWDVFVSAAQRILILGLHRKVSLSSHYDRSRIEVDCARRTFWSAYCLDNHFSITLGHPRIFHDEDIDQELPSGADDELVEGHFPSKYSHKHSTMLAPVAYYQLYRILSLVLREIYSIQPVSNTDMYALAQKYSQRLREWRKNIPDFLQTNDQVSAPLVPIFQRQRDVLNVNYWHAVIIVLRPLLLRDFSQFQQGTTRARTNVQTSQIRASVTDCVAAAINLVKIVDEMFQTGDLFPSLWGTCYYGFSATVVLYVFAIQEASSPKETYQSYLDAATRCHDQLSTLVEKSSLVARYCLILEELRIDALRNSRGNYESSTIDLDSYTSASISTGPSAEFPQTVTAHMMYPNINEENVPMFEHNCSNAITGATSWLQFESLVVPRFPNFESLPQQY